MTDTEENKHRVFHGGLMKGAPPWFSVSQELGGSGKSFSSMVESLDPTPQCIDTIIYKRTLFVIPVVNTITILVENK